MNKESCVYFILDEKSEAIKIGKADDIGDRLPSLQTGNPNQLIVLNTIKCESVKHAFNLEQKFHNFFGHLHIRGEWFSYDKDIFKNFFFNQSDFQPKEKRNPLIIQSLFGEETIFDIKKHPRCRFYENHVAQIKESYENATKLTLPYRTMKYPTHGKSMLLPHSLEKDRVFISTRKHQENLEYNKFLTKNNSIQNSVEQFV